MASTRRNLSMVRGDTFCFDVILRELDDSTVESIYFTIKKKITDTEPIIQKSLGNGITNICEHIYRVRVAPEDTSGVAKGRYEYDLQIGVGADIYTVLLGVMEIFQDVTEN